MMIDVMENQHETTEVAQIILHAVDSVQYGKHKLACFLKGSRSKEIIPKIHENVFGGLLWHNISTIEYFIEQLEAMGFIERREKQGYPYPFSVYALTDAGRKVIDEKMQDEIMITVIATGFKPKPKKEKFESTPDEKRTPLEDIRRVEIPLEKESVDLPVFLKNI